MNDRKITNVGGITIFKRKFYLYYLLPLLLWLTVIYISSSQSYETQNVQPMLGEFNLSWVETFAKDISFQYGDSEVSLETRSPAAFVEFFLRKGAHLVVFAILAILSYRVFYYMKAHQGIASLGAWTFVTLYAAIDELRQHFHPYRSGMIEDVVLDSIGGLLGIAIIVVWRKWRGRDKS
ncbi:VanZ family protein [Evansella cellulosilytica]|uniref:VanZ family protein n=1 Tax=Evansella cellulosilytica (strain ATCC 21833 / DSM 2522 / FERM P-1141 / JCM 9156 / N-4) TaxID=649639 RepID=E6TSC8_EVAC2|nr:VanZ family protein [Evansella cellulosilytica]ADU31897.1 VanZ family protein [Evansella cellulosilytica DSM 2522]